MKNSSPVRNVYIGKKDSKIGTFLPNKKYYELYGDDADTAGIQTSSVVKSVDFGNIYLMNQASSACGLKQALKDIFPECREDILVCAMHSCSENEALYLCEDKEGTYNIHCRENVIRKQLKLTGYFVILTNDSKDPEYILNVYRTKDVVEKSFDNIKNELDLERLRIHSDEAMEGRIFICFISLVITSYIRGILENKNLYSIHSLSRLYSELKKLRLIQFYMYSNF